MNYYNEFDPDAAAWLGELVSAGNIPAGRIDTRSVVDVRPGDLAGHAQCHFFAGIGGWAYALKLAGWPESKPVWTASLPCQPFSVAGKGLGEADERHLWPVFRELVRECKPPIIFGEQVSSSTVIGKVCGIEEMQEVLDREAVLGVLRQFQRASEDDMQGLRVRNGAGSEVKEHQEKVRAIQRVAENEARACPDGGCEVQSEEARPSIRFGSGGDPDSGGCREVRVDGHSVQPERAESVECAITGPDCSGGGIREEQRKGGALLTERDGEHLGAEQDFGDCVGDFSPEEGPVERFIQSDWCEASAEIEKAWFDGIRADLERDGYAVWACSACAAGIGAPHIRQRLYWTAIRLADAGCQYDERLGIHRELPSSYGETEGAVQEWERGWDAVGGGCQADRPADGIVPGLEGHAGDESDRNESGRDGSDATGSTSEGGCDGGLADPNVIAFHERGQNGGGRDQGGDAEQGPGSCGGGNAGRLADLHSSGSLPSTHSGVCGGEEGSGPRNGEPERCGEFGGLSDGINSGLEGLAGHEHHRDKPGRDGSDATGSTSEGGSPDRLGESNGDGREPWRTPAASSGHRGSIDATGGWSDFYLVQCRDGKVRRVGTGLFPLAHGLPCGVVPSGDPDQQEANASQEARKVRLKGYGNAIVPQLAAQFIRAVMDVLGDIKTH